jgi:hypothetical protein
MSWLRDRIPGWRRAKRREEPAAEQPFPEPPVVKPAMPGFERARLVLLVRDAAGPASYQLHSFEDEPEAAAFVQFWFPGNIENGVIAFWASHDEPEIGSNDGPAEVVVLVRDETGPKTVYPFSFTDMDLAESWVEREEELGLNVDQLLVYWAVPARISRDHWGRVHLWPSEPPALKRRGRLATPPKPVFQEQPRRPQRPEAAPAEARSPLADELPVSLEAAETEQAVDTTPEEPAAASAEAQEPPEAIQAAPAGPFIGTSDEPQEPPEAVETAPAGPFIRTSDEAQEPPEAVEAAPGPLARTPDEEAVAASEEVPEPPVQEPPETETAAEPFSEAAEEPPEAAVEEPATLEATPSGDADEPLDPNDESDRLLGQRRWQRRQGPFRGFGSPPGKF